MPPLPEVAAPEIAVVVPCFRTREQVLGVLARIGPECKAIYVVDDACPDGTGKHVQASCRDPRVRVLFHSARLPGSNALKHTAHLVA